MTLSPTELYLKLIVEPTVEEFQLHPISLRHAYLACAAVYHTIDRIAAQKHRSVKDIRQQWGRKSLAFKVMDIVAHDFKHIHATNRRAPAQGLPLEHAIYGGMGFNTHAFNDTGEVVALRHITFLCRDAVKFLREQIKFDVKTRSRTGQPLGP